MTTMPSTGSQGRLHLPTTMSCTSFRPRKWGAQKNLRSLTGTSAFMWFMMRILGTLYYPPEPTLLTFAFLAMGILFSLVSIPLVIYDWVNTGDKEGE